MAAANLSARFSDAKIWLLKSLFLSFMPNFGVILFGPNIFRSSPIMFVNFLITILSHGDHKFSYTHPTIISFPLLLARSPSLSTTVNSIAAFLTLQPLFHRLHLHSFCQPRPLPPLERRRCPLSLLAPVTTPDLTTLYVCVSSFPSPNPRFESNK